MKRKLARAVTGSIVITLLALGAGIIAIDRYGSTDQSRPADVIIVLGAQVLPNGQPGPALARRARHAAALYRQGLAPAVLCTGGVGRFPPSEARAACALIQSMGVPGQAIALEENSHSTEENAIYSSAILRQRGWQTAILVSDGYHVYRGSLLFERAGVRVFASPAQVTAGPMDPIERTGREAREALAVAWYWIKTALGLRITNLK